MRPCSHLHKLHDDMTLDRRVVLACVLDHGEARMHIGRAYVTIGYIPDRPEISQEAL
jgi:hypothetical protein